MAETVLEWWKERLKEAYDKRILTEEFSQKTKGQKVTLLCADTGWSRPTVEKYAKMLDIEL